MWMAITINTAMFTSSVLVQAHLETDVRAVVLAYQAAGPIGQELGDRTAECGEVIGIVLHLLEIQVVMAVLEAIGRVEPCPAASR